jgi:hypothetical protein
LIGGVSLFLRSVFLGVFCAMGAVVGWSSEILVADWRKPMKPPKGFVSGIGGGLWRPFEQDGAPKGVSLLVALTGWDLPWVGQVGADGRGTWLELPIAVFGEAYAYMDFSEYWKASKGSGIWFSLDERLPLEGHEFIGIDPCFPDFATTCKYDDSLGGFLYSSDCGAIPFGFILSFWGLLPVMPKFQSLAFANDSVEVAVG